MIREGKINEHGVLEIKRAGKFKSQVCMKAGFHVAIGNPENIVRACGDDCPFFSEPEFVERRNGADAPTNWCIKICHGEFLWFDEFEDERQCDD